MIEGLATLTNVTLLESTNSVWNPLINIVNPFVGKVIILLGGIVGVYIIILIFRLNYERKKYKLLKHILYDLDQLNIHYGIKTSRENKGMIHKLIRKIIRKVKKENKDNHTQNRPPRAEIWK